jgi:hypothetical protein
MVTRRIVRRSLGALGLAAVALAAMAATAGPASAATTPPPKPSVYSFDTGWVTNYDGGCAVKAHVDYYPSSDTAFIQTTVQDPYWFAACRAVTHVWVQTSGNVFAGATQGSMACAVYDTTCSSTQTYTGTYSGQTPGLTAYVDSVNEALQDAGMPASYTRTQATTGITVSFSKA